VGILKKIYLIFIFKKVLHENKLFTLYKYEPKKFKTYPILSRKIRFGIAYALGGLWMKLYEKCGIHWELNLV
jgi:hypothetical protein